MQSNIKCTSIHRVGVLKEVEQERGIKFFQELKNENIPNLKKNINLHIKETQQTLRSVNTKRSTRTYYSKNIKRKIQT